MPNLKHIKVRIKSIKSTKKITQAMKLVAASKVRRAQIRVLNSRPYTQHIINFIHKAVVSISSLDKNEIPLMRERLVKSVGIIVISSDRGLCGSYNTNILKKAMRRIIELEKSGVKLKLITIGNKANNFFKRTRVEILDNFTQLPAIPNIELANLIAGSAENAFLNKTVDQVEIIGTDFISMLRNEVYTKQFLPIIPDTSSGNKQPSEILFEPTLDMVLGSLLPLYLSN